MNQKAEVYWNEFWQGKNEEKPHAVSAWQFGADPDQLAQLVINGRKTATCSAHVFYEIENEPMPSVGDYSIILSSEDRPVAIIRTVNVEVVPMNEVSEEFAISEGEGDGTYTYWWNAHEHFFKKELHKLGHTFKEDMLLVCESFELIHVK
ncbi:ASCH domain-containing protein [Peribacillus muralis]|uniref:ASCH domain-containing protein n=1 Tax=Peribacillus muralis TaxID=264697 RepID=UPI001F4DEB2C|nr:ASCH domain-containing protein [Peribacillus muralis]MCK1992097.1 ASCH domain-containing protein [Peribacillus muralis]MCK2012653.1 ASCH domain-containing protein [Peribacillus muralis]